MYEAASHQLVFLLVSDRSEWAGRVVDECRKLHPLVERWEWSEAESLKDPADALLLDVTGPFAQKLPLFEKWCAKGWQPVCLVSLAPEPGAGEFGTSLADLGFQRVVVTGSQPPYWQELRSELQVIVVSDARLVPQIAKYLGWGCDPPVIQALAIALQLMPERRTVRAWATELGFTSRQQLEDLLGRRGLPNPKVILDRLRLARVVDYAARSRGSLTRDQLARLFHYPSGGYLGKRAKDLTGLPLGRLVETGVSQVFAGLKAL